MPWMSSKVAQAKTADAQRSSAAGPKGAALDPPSYGIDFVDRKLHRKNKTGLPDQLKAGIEKLSGMAMDDVRVHYNSSKPAQMQALAYTQGTDIHVGPGQERHLPHEAWHVVQQKEGRVKPTRQAKDVAINDDQRLEAEADRIGQQTMNRQPPVQAKTSAGNASGQSDLDDNSEASRSDTGGVIQGRFYVEASPNTFLTTIQNALGNLIGNAAPALNYVAAGTTREITIAGGPVQAPANRPQSLALVQRIINSPFSATIRSTLASNRVEPVRRRRFLFFRESVRNVMGRISRSPGGPGVGNDVNVFINTTTMGGAPTSAVWKVNALGQENQVVPPDSIILGHELGHADRFMRGEGAFTAGGGHELGNFTKVSGQASAAPLEEIYNIGLTPAAGLTAQNPDLMAISENILRTEHGFDLRSRYT